MTTFSRGCGSVAAMAIDEKCPACSGAVTYIGLFVIECATPACENFPGAKSVARDIERTAAARVIESEEADLFDTLAFAYF